MELTGGAALLGVKQNDCNGQLLSLLVSVLVIFIIMAIVFRSFVGGLFATLPMGISVVMMFGLWDI